MTTVDSVRGQLPCCEACKTVDKYTIAATDGDIGQVKDVDFDDHAWVGRYLVDNMSNCGAADVANRAQAAAAGPHTGG